MRRLSLTAMPSRRQKQQQRASLSSACGKSTSSLRSTFGNFSMLSSLSGSLSSDSLTSLSTASSSYGGFMEDYDDVDEELEDQECCEQGWMYWKKDADCWLKILRSQASGPRTSAASSPGAPPERAWSSSPMSASVRASGSTRCTSRRN
ncbi:uncharacterized protein IUM83_09168 [Phytophthora cinnamomi]|uniref:uncharacterized protein n=1 Tax=Phytophthora cinnamomi TaxID=4785 RepID=UPI003559A320|nr:hypothetical protein IUM83_09168 [Phytophthora cinnamomi]